MYSCVGRSRNGLGPNCILTTLKLSHTSLDVDIYYGGLFIFYVIIYFIRRDFAFPYFTGIPLAYHMIYRQVDCEQLHT